MIPSQTSPKKPDFHRKRHSIPMDVLKSSPSAAQIEEIINATQIASDIELLRLVSALLKYTVPEAYLSLPKTFQNSIARVFSTPIGLGNLTARIAMFSRSKTDIHRDVSMVLDAHTQLLGNVLVPGLVEQLLKTTSSVSRKEVEKLLFKGKLYAIIREAAANFSHFHVPFVLQDMDAYTTFLAKELLAVEDAATLSVSLLSLGPPAPFFDVFFTRENCAFLRKTISAMIRFERKAVLVKFLDYGILRYLNSSATDETIAALASLNTSFLDNSLWDELLLEKVVSRYNYKLNSMVALSVNADHLVNKFLGAWGASTVLANEPIVKQGYRTHLLLCLCAQLAPEKLQDMLKSTEFVSAITSRLSSLSSQVKYLGVFFADNVCKMAAAPPIFDMSDLGEIGLDIPADFAKKSDFAMNVENAWDVLEAPLIVEADPDMEVVPDLEPLQIRETARNGPERDFNMSDEEDDPTLASREKVAAPIYVRDLLSYLSADTKDTNAYEKRKIALEIAPTLLRQKSAFGNEVSFYAHDLLAQLVGLTNHYEEKDFETSRLNAMVALVVSHPGVAPQICKLLLTGDYSLQQRLSLLSAMSFGSRALRGHSDEIVESSFTATEFPTELLPPRLHVMYATDFGYARLENAIQNDLMKDAADEARDQLVGGKVLRVSAKLRKEPVALTVSRDKLASFPDIVGRTFFFPLVAVWYESGGINIGHYTPVLIAHYIRTLSLILHCGYPAAADLTEMASEYLTLVTPVIQTVKSDQLQVIESVVTGALLICETLDDSYLITTFDGHLHIIESAISQWWESLIDDRVKSLCAGLLLRLSHLRENMQRTILDQMNGGFYS